jgi:hypothetical protein
VVLNVAGGLFFLALLRSSWHLAVAFSGFHLALFTLAVVGKLWTTPIDRNDADSHVAMRIVAEIV